MLRNTLEIQDPSGAQLYNVVDCTNGCPELTYAGGLQGAGSSFYQPQANYDPSLYGNLFAPYGGAAGSNNVGALASSSGFGADSFGAGGLAFGAGNSLGSNIFGSPAGGADFAGGSIFDVAAIPAQPQTQAQASETGSGKAATGSDHDYIFGDHKSKSSEEHHPKPKKNKRKFLVPDPPSSESHSHEKHKHKRKRTYRPKKVFRKPPIVVVKKIIAASTTTPIG